MKIRIIQLGFETFSGLLGDVHFDNGVSVDEVSDIQAEYVRAIFVTENIEPEAAEQDPEENPEEVTE